MTHRCGHPCFRSKFAVRPLPTFPDSASTAENAHNMRQCGAGFLNLAGVLNPELGQLQDGGDAFRRWQRCLLSYRRGHRNRSLASSQLRSRNSGGYSRQSTALVPRAQDARLNDGHQVHGVDRVSFDSRLLPIFQPNSKMPYRLRQWFRRTKTCGTATLPGATTPMAVIRAPTVRLPDISTTAPPCSRRRRRH